MTDAVSLPDDAKRPRAPKLADATDAHRRSGRRLAQFHAMHLRELARVNQAMAEVFAGNGSAETLLATISSMQMIANMRRFGNLCGAACQMLTGHHTIEDQWVFPALEGHSDGLDKVVRRLREEHLVIHDLLDQLEAAAVDLLANAGTGNAAALRTRFKHLESFVISHFGYEQTELEESLGYYGVDI